MRAPEGWGGSGLLVAIPARDEAARLGRALGALARDGVRDVVVMANGCADGTARAARHPGLRVAVIETGPLAGGVGEARAIALEQALRRAPDAHAIATTDADCAVVPGWRRAMLSALERAEMVCGRVLPDPTEFAALPAVVRRHGTLGDLRDALRAEIAALERPAPHDPWPCHGQAPGASLAFRPRAYLAAGGFAPLRCHEDREIAERVAARGWRVAHPMGAAVVASCRLRGRAPGGMADTIAARASDELALAREIPALEAQIRALAARRDALRLGAPPADAAARFGQGAPRSMVRAP